MSRPRSGWWLSALLLFGCIVLATLLGLQWRARYASPAAEISSGGEQAPPADPAVPLAARYSPPALAAFDEILERPLFLRDRRPVKIAEPTEPTAPPPAQLRIRLEGIAKVGGSSVAVLRDLSTNEGLRLSEGMQYKGWTLEAVEPERAVLKRGDSLVQELKLERQ
jgi:hypothetical protein